MAAIPDYSLWSGEVENVIRNQMSSVSSNETSVNYDVHSSKYVCKAISKTQKALAIQLPDERQSRKLKASLSIKNSTGEKINKFTTIDDASVSSDSDLEMSISIHSCKSEKSVPQLTLGKLSNDSIQFANRQKSTSTLSDTLSGYDSASSENLAKFNTEFQTKYSLPQLLGQRSTSNGSTNLQNLSIFSKATYASEATEYNSKYLPGESKLSQVDLIKDENSTIVVRCVDTLPSEQSVFTVKSLLYRIFCCENQKSMTVSESLSKLSDLKSDCSINKDKINMNIDILKTQLSEEKKAEKDDVNDDKPSLPEKKSGHNILMNNFFENLNTKFPESPDSTSLSSTNSDDFQTLSSLDIATYQQQIQYINSQHPDNDLKMLPEIPDATEFNNNNSHTYYEEEEWDGRFQPVLSVILEE